MITQPPKQQTWKPEDLIYRCDEGWNPGVVTFNTINRFGRDSHLVELDPRDGEFGYTTLRGAYHAIKFLAPTGYVTRILKYDLDVVAKWSGREPPRKDRSAWGLMALHTVNPDAVGPWYPNDLIAIDTWNRPLGRDVIKWAQMPIVDERLTIKDDHVINGLLLKNTLWVKHAMFNNKYGDEIQIETTGEFTFWFEREGNER